MDHWNAEKICRGPRGIVEAMGGQVAEADKGTEFGAMVLGWQLD
jgi:hypothetical protein